MLQGSTLSHVITVSGEALPVLGKFKCCYQSQEDIILVIFKCSKISHMKQCLEEIFLCTDGAVIDLKNGVSQLEDRDN